MRLVLGQMNATIGDFAGNGAKVDRRMLSRFARDGGVPVVSGNLAGGNEELVFDRGSMALDGRGRVLARAADSVTGLALPSRYSSESSSTDARALAAGIARQIDRAEYKRQQAAPGLRVSTSAFGSGRRIPIAQVSGA